MFETVAPEKFAPRSHKAAYESLPVSIALHAVAIMAVIIGAAWNVAFPLQSPKLLRSYSLVTIPEPPPPPPPPPPPKSAVVQPQQPHQQAPVLMTEVLAPTVIPDVIPVVSNLPPPVDLPGAVPAGVEGGVEGGIPGGQMGGVLGGEIGGIKGGTLGGIFTDNRVHIERDKPLPMHPVSQVYPIYPENARLRHWEDSLIVRYVIGKDGRIKDVQVISHAERTLFEETAVKAIRNWRFRPLIKDGQATEVVHELTVNFKLEAS
jgi:protein TonB